MPKTRRRRKALPLLDGDNTDQLSGLTLEAMVARGEGSDGLSIEDDLIRCSRAGDPDRFAPLDLLIPSVEMGR